ncbi:cytochrome c oxidase subunit II [Pseudoduganella chitinolytica]|uniref:C-type cytochrome n=1 Tax=Pseudoduganella chitinolytica TaxID=34070 RepID=A0ABY8BID5_9BURK|nr:c-type cytochrome [Pseudoduganella chitinolytica]WEF34432.1 c-type cytochrome [Pseudoduganella chitinolytica]
MTAGFFDPAGLDAVVIARLGWTMFIAAAIILAALTWLTLAALRHERRPIRARWWIVGGGLAFPVLGLTALLAWSSVATARLSPQTSLTPLRIAVTGHMWWWQVRYTDPATGREFELANEVHIPAGRPVFLALGAADVIHAFWVPALGGKIDMVPGRLHGLAVQALRPGVYRGQCAEYCGEQHARMALEVVAHPPAEYDAWLAAQARPASAPASAELARGRAVFLAQRCQACHAVRGVTAQPAGATLGPDLTHVGSRRTIAAGTLPTHAATLAGWVADPQAHKPGARMPATRALDGADLRALAAWLESLK